MIFGIVAGVFTLLSIGLAVLVICQQRRFMNNGIYGNNNASDTGKVDVLVLLFAAKPFSFYFVRCMFDPRFVK